jgi:hypothetical protein
VGDAGITDGLIGAADGDNQTSNRDEREQNFGNAHLTSS